jgi:hypothetical protein
MPALTEAAQNLASPSGRAVLRCLLGCALAALHASTRSSNPSPTRRPATGGSSCRA